MKIKGTKEWAVAEINCSQGCPHNCRYCYARYDAVERKGDLSLQQWTTCKPIDCDPKRFLKRYDGQIMFPTAHDIVPENLNHYMEHLRLLLEAGNRVLIVSKPHFSCIEKLCEVFSSWRKQILYRFTITARKDELLRYWEPKAPLFQERYDCLAHAFEKGFQTSVSVEPMLDVKDVIKMIDKLYPYVTHSIWIGMMNKIDKRITLKTKTDYRQVERILEGQSQKSILAIYDALRSSHKIRWKESIKTVVGLDLAHKAGLDI